MYPYQQRKEHPEVAVGEDGVGVNIRNRTREQPIREVLQLSA